LLLSCFMAARKKMPTRLKRLARATTRRGRVAVRRIRRAKRGLPASARKSSIQARAVAQRLAEPPAPLPESAPVHHVDHGDGPSRFWGPVGAWVLVIGVAGVALLAAGLPSSTTPPDASREDRAVELEADAQLPASVPSKQAQATASRTAPVKATEPGPANDSRASESRAPQTHTALLAEPRTPPVAAFAGLPAAEPASIALRDETPLVTLSGCLDLDDDDFRLKNATGAEAPKARSWKTGFLTKRSSDVTVVANRLDLRSHVGRRVTLTGDLADRRLQVRSLQPSTVSCKN
jgi:hypothetical protein